MFGTENEGFRGLVKPFFNCIAIATEAKNGKIRARNAKFVGKILTQDEFNKKYSCLRFYALENSILEKHGDCAALGMGIRANKKDRNLNGRGLLSKEQFPVPILYSRI